MSETDSVFKIVTKSNITLAIIIREKLDLPETIFFSNPDDVLQIGLIVTNKTRGIAKHRHLRNERKIFSTSEFLHIQNGECVLILNDWDQTEEFRVNLKTRDSVLLLNGCHALESLTNDLKILEVKQGPYAEATDKEYV